MRKRFVVTLTTDGGAESQVTLWAESPEHAVIKAKARADPSVKIVEAYAKEDE